MERQTRRKQGRLWLIFGGQRRLNETLCVAALSDNSADVLALIEDGANPDARMGGCTALMIAAQHGHRAAIVALLSCGADVFARTQSRRTALHFALESGHVELLSLLHAVAVADSRAPQNKRHERRAA